MRSISSIVSRARSSIVATACAERSLSRSRGHRLHQDGVQSVPGRVVQLPGDPGAFLGDHELVLVTGAVELVGDVGADRPAPVTDQPSARPDQSRQQVVRKPYGVTASSMSTSATHPAAAVASTGHDAPRRGRTATAYRATAGATGACTP
jgi:hypothetical protein